MIGTMRSGMPPSWSLPTKKKHDGLNHTQPWSRMWPATVAQSASLKGLDATLRRTIAVAQFLL